MLVLNEQRAARQLSEITLTTRVEQVRRAVLEGILTGAIRPGARLIEAALAKQLGVSQATVNQALQDLHAQGMVNKSTNRGTTVLRFGLIELEALFSVRAVLECIAAETAARSPTPSAVEGLRRWVEQMRTAGKSRHLAEFYLADYEFHQNLYRLSHNRFLVQACQAVAAAPFAYILCDRPKPLPADYREIAEDHEEVIQALLQGPAQALRVTQTKVSKWLKWQREFVTEQL
jgi:DNA-binding GntR family transcriptional regulator